MAYTAKQILQQLDKCAKGSSFPMLDNGYIYLVNSRLTAYRDHARWAIIIEVVGFNPRAGGHNGIANCLYIFGNCLDYKPGINEENYLYFTNDSDEGETFDPEYEEYLNPEVGTMLLRGKQIAVSHEPSFYESKGIHLEEAPQILIWEFLRGINAEYKVDFFATEAEIRARIPQDLPLLLKLEEWYHNDLAKGEKPSEVETFQMIAQVLETGNPERYHPTNKPNTHWQNWPESGIL